MKTLNFSLINMDYRDFYIWLDGFMTNRSWTVIQQSDIEMIKIKMKEVHSGKNELSTQKIIIKQPFDPIQIQTPKNPFDITCKTNLDD